MSQFPEPTLIHLQGDKSLPLFVSILLHGNEYSGLKAVQAIIRRYQNHLPRSLYLFIGNVSATAGGLRVIPGQTDYNRCWPGTEMPANHETRMMQEVIDRVTAGRLFAAVDIHNNSGMNPHYACMTDVTQDNQHLAAMFNHIAVVFRRPKGVSTMSFDGICPAVTLECGRPGDEMGIRHATELLDALLHLDHFPEKALARHDLQLVRSYVTVNVPDSVSIGFDASEQADLIFDKTFERWNFTEIQPDHILAHTRVEQPLIVTDQRGVDITSRVIRVEDGKVFLKRTLMPGMITIDEAIIRQDCLCYFMEDYHLELEHPDDH
ncbi:MAG: peptidase M14 [Gammaproteobacteria bacterium]|nr:peptidase M14 [Gammaproteobacteria bacterium]